MMSWRQRRRNAQHSSAAPHSRGTRLMPLTDVPEGCEPPPEWGAVLQRGPIARMFMLPPDHASLRVGDRIVIRRDTERPYRVTAITPVGSGMSWTLSLEPVDEEACEGLAQSDTRRVALARHFRFTAAELDAMDDASVAALLALMRRS